MKKVALVIIYNHQYNKNIEVLERIYKDRFEHVYHLVPFYNGNKPNVIPVYESSIYFQGYVAQGLGKYFDKKFAHYFFVADDLMLNPKINQDNYAEHLNLTEDACFIPGLVSLHEKTTFWSRTAEAYHWSKFQEGLEAADQIPSYEEALSKFEKFDLTLKPLRFTQIHRLPDSFYAWARPLVGKKFFQRTNLLYRYLKSKLKKERYALPYPITGSYSDIFVISADTIQQFCHYCGVFAATKLFVELGLPTAMVLSAKKIVFERDLQLQGRALWTAKDLQELEKFEKSYQKLADEFPANYLYLHPIKLSQWH